MKVCSVESILLDIALVLCSHGDEYTQAGP